jgi:uncharacterized protein (TIGR02594 family)
MNFTRKQIRTIQRALHSSGYYLDGKVDGDWGPKTDRAVVAFKASKGLRARPYIGPITWGLLVENRPVTPQVSRTEPKWLKVARSFLGLEEYHGIRHNQQILDWWDDIKMGGVNDDETPWCAAFVGGVLEECGIRSTRSGLARSYDRWGKTLGKKPALGSVVTFWRSSPESWKGHVGFVAGKDQDGKIMCLGGNQGNSVSIRPFSSRRVIGFYWPNNTPEDPEFTLPVIGSDGRLSTNEA